MSKQIKLLVALTGVGVFLILVFDLAINKPIPTPLTASASVVPKSVKTVIQPLRLKIPKIGLDAAIEKVGLTPAGAMDVPKRPADVAWLNLGPAPGGIGSAVIAGHYGYKNGSAFDNLHKLRIGDKISVNDEKGATVIFLVRELRTYTQNQNASNVFNSSDGKAHLNLITCQGVWNQSQKSYSQRLIVFTDKVE